LILKIEQLELFCYYYYRTGVIFGIEIWKFNGMGSKEEKGDKKYYSKK